MDITQELPSPPSPLITEASSPPSLRAIVFECANAEVLPTSFFRKMESQQVHLISEHGLSEEAIDARWLEITKRWINPSPQKSSDPLPLTPSQQEQATDLSFVRGEEEAYIAESEAEEFYGESYSERLRSKGRRVPPPLNLVEPMATSTMTPLAGPDPWQGGFGTRQQLPLHGRSVGVQTAPEEIVKVEVETIVEEQETDVNCTGQQVLEQAGGVEQEPNVNRTGQEVLEQAMEAGGVEISGCKFKLFFFNFVQKEKKMLLSDEERYPPLDILFAARTLIKAIDAEIKNDIQKSHKDSNLKKKGRDKFELAELHIRKRLLFYTFLKRESKLL